MHLHLCIIAWAPMRAQAGLQGGAEILLVTSLLPAYPYQLCCAMLLVMHWLRLLQYTITDHD